MRSRDVPDEERDSIISELAHGCATLYLQPTNKELLCEVCGNAYPLRAYYVYAANPFTWDHDLYPWGVVCMWCMASIVAEGAVTQPYRGG